MAHPCPPKRPRSCGSSTTRADRALVSYTRTMTQKDASALSRDPLYDLLRVVAILAVIGIHVLAPYMRVLKESGADRGLVWLFDQTLFVAVPLFLFVSGALVWRRCAPMDRGAYAAFMRRRALVVGVPYVMWTVIYFVISPGTHAVSGSWVERLVSVAVALVNGTAFYHLYFIPVLFVYYALTPVAVAVGRRSPEALLVGVILIRALLGPSIVDLVNAAGPLAQFRPLIEVAVVRMPYMALGAWFAYRREAMEPLLRIAWPLLLAVGLATFPTQVYGVVRPLSLELLRVAEVLALSAVILGVVGLARLVVGRNAAFDARVHTLAGMAFGVYLAHPLVLWMLRKIIGTMGDVLPAMLPVMGVPALFAATAGASLVLVMLLKRNQLTARFI